MASEEVSRLARLLLFGGKYNGKTTALCKIIKALNHKAIVVTADSAWSTYQDSRWIDCFTRVQWDGFKLLHTLADGIINKQPGYDFDWLLVDPISSGVNEWMGHTVKARKFKDQRDPDVPSWTHFGLLLFEMRELMEKFKKLPCHVAFTTHFVDRETEANVKRSNLPMETYNTIADAGTNLIGWCFRDKTSTADFKVQVEPSPLVIAGTQIPDIPLGTYHQDKFVELVVNWLK
jgi:hypothetical protein